ncbi:hypothetical protein CUMW_289930, partial [Citrus unshiu]
HHHKEHEKPEGATGYSDSTTGYSDQSATAYSETTGYPGDRCRPSETESGDYGRKEEEVDYKKEEKHHKHLEHLGELGTAGAGAFALLEKHKAEKDPEHAHRHKIEEEIAAAASRWIGRICVPRA